METLEVRPAPEDLPPRLRVYSCIASGGMALAGRALSFR